MREFDNLDVTTKFTESWKNLQPTRNRKNATTPAEPVALGNKTKKGELERLRLFRYCADRKWLTVNNAVKITISVRTDKKFGMEMDEEERFFARIPVHCIDGRGANGGYNAQQLRVFCLVMRHAGLRISDVTMLNERQLVRRASGEGWALKVFQKKTDEWVYIPVPVSACGRAPRITLQG